MKNISLDAEMKRTTPLPYSVLLHSSEPLSKTYISPHQNTRGAQGTEIYSKSHHSGSKSVSNHLHKTFTLNCLATISQNISETPPEARIRGQAPETIRMARRHTTHVTVTSDPWHNPGNLARWRQRVIFYGTGMKIYECESMTIGGPQNEAIPSRTHDRLMVQTEK